MITISFKFTLRSVEWWLDYDIVIYHDKVRLAAFSSCVLKVFVRIIESEGFKRDQFAVC